MESERRWSDVNSHQLEKGQGFLEYALILIIVSILVMAALALMGPAIGKLYSDVIPMI
jgi:pilus assembly protein Flp/PilA